MEYLVTSEEMRIFDAYTINELGVPGIVLMEKAAAGACSHILANAQDRIQNAHVLALCGTGNNGGDGLVLARLLRQKHVSVDVILVGDQEKTSELNMQEQQILANYGVPVNRTDAAKCEELICTAGYRYDVIIDALFGIGLSRPLSGDYARLVEFINSYGAYVYAMDVPSGLRADGGGTGYPCIRADVTYTFGFVKLGLVTYPGAAFCGEVIRIDMGIDEFSMGRNKPVYRRITDRSEIDWPDRVDHANKGTYGKLLVVAGSKEIYGAAYMAAKAAFATGVGMVRVFTHSDNRLVLETALPEAMYSFYDDDTPDEELTEKLKELYGWADGILAGPGIGTGHASELMVRSILHDTDLPVLFDADAIKIIADSDDLKKHIASLRDRSVIMTPHMGEYAYLVRTTIIEAKEHMTDSVKKTADELGISIICKDARSLIASARSEEIYVNCSGNDGMATAGSGDVLSGMCAVLMIQTLDVVTACAHAAYLHGLAGDDAAARCGKCGMTASDIIDSIQTVIG